MGEFAKYAFCGLKRKSRDFERSVLRYVSIKIPALTHSGRKRRVCVNQPDGLCKHPSEIKEGKKEGRKEGTAGIDSADRGKGRRWKEKTKPLAL